MTFLHDSTPVPFEQDSPSTTVSPFEIPTVKPLGDSPVLSHYGRLNALMTCPEQVYVDLSKPSIVKDGYEIPFKNPTDLHLHLMGYAGVWDIGLVVHEVQPQPVQLAQADAARRKLPPVVTGNSYQDADYVRVRLAREAGCKRICGNQPDLPVCTKCFVNAHAGQYNPKFHGYENWLDVFESMSRVHGWTKPAMTAQPVQLAQADASNGQNSPSNSVKAPETLKEWLAQHIANPPEPVMGYCPECGELVDVADNFPDDPDNYQCPECFADFPVSEFVLATPQPVQLAQADASNGQNAPDVSPDPTSYNLPNNCPNCGSELDPYWDFDAWHCSSCLDIVQAVPLAELVAQDQAEAYLEAEAVHFAGQYPVMDYPAIDAGIKAQLDRMEALLLEIKAVMTNGFTFNPQGLE